MESTELARLRRVAGKQTTRLTRSGRKTGKPHKVTIWFVLDGDKLYIGTANVNRQWVRNIHKTPKIKLSMGGERFAGNARFLTEPRQARGGDGCHSADVLDVSTDSRAWACPKRNGADARQYRIVRGYVGCLDLANLPANASAVATQVRI